MRIWYRTGIAMPAGVLRQLIPGHQTHGATTGEELVSLMRIFGLKPLLSQTGRDAVKVKLKMSQMAGVPTLLLGEWEQRGVLHWVLVVAVDGDGVTVNDPWGGRRVRLSWDNVDAAYDGTCIL